MSGSEDEVALTTEEALDRAKGASLTDIAKRGVGGWLLALAAAFITGTQKIFALLILPFEIFVEAGRTSLQGFIITPIVGNENTPGLIQQGVETSGRFLGGFEIFALPVSTLIVLISLGFVAAVVAFGWTSNILPGLLVDNPIWDFVFATPEEEVEGED